MKRGVGRQEMNEHMRRALLTLLAIHFAMSLTSCTKSPDLEAVIDDFEKATEGLATLRPISLHSPSPPPPTNLVQIVHRWTADLSILHKERNRLSGAQRKRVQEIQMRFLSTTTMNMTDMQRSKLMEGLTEEQKVKLAAITNSFQNTQ